MPRRARVVIPGCPHHVTQRGNRRQQTFFETADYLCYIAHLREWCRRFSIDVWAWCLMPNHVHHILVPPSEDSLRSALSEAHRLSHVVKDRLMAQHPQIVDAVIHIEPPPAA